MITIKRVYEPASPGDGFRILVDRLWPRGLKRESAKIDLWARDLSPSTELRGWFNHEPAKWPEFRDRFHRELEAPEHANELAAIRDRADKGPVVLLFAARDEEYNNARALMEFLSEKSPP